MGGSAVGAVVVNPRYDEDIRRLDGLWDLSRVLTEETVFVVTGCNVLSELLDRPVAAALRDAIDLRGDPESGRRAIVIGDVCWAADWDGDLSRYPMICIGGPPVVQEVASHGECRTDGDTHWAWVAGPPERVAVRGGTATETRDAVESFIRTQDGLDAFLRRVWEG